MAKLQLSLILAFLLLASATPAHAGDPWPEGWRVVHHGAPGSEIPSSSYIRFVDPLNGWASYGIGGVLRTTDGGQTWTDQPSLRFTPYVFVTPLIGWAGRWEACRAAWSIDMTTDGGVTWTQQIRDSSNYCGPGSVSLLHFVDTQFGWADVWAGPERPGGLIRTTDGGKTWQPWTPNIPSFDYLKFASRSVWYGLTGDGDTDDHFPIWRIWKTTDGGATTVAGGRLLWALPRWLSTRIGNVPYFHVASDTNTIVVGGRGGRIQRSTDFGLTWQEIANPLSGDVQTRFADDLHGWAFAGKTLAHTSDGGLSWQVQPTSNAADISDLSVVDANHAFFLARGLYRTVDGGATWVALQNGSNGDVGDLAVTPGGCLYGAGAAPYSTGSTIGTYDGGMTWSEYGFQSTRVDTVGEDHVWALGSLDSPYLYRSTDAGKTWITSTLETNFLAMDFVDAERGWAVSHGGLYKSEDGGATWGQASLGTGCQCEGVSFQDVFFVDGQHGWILGVELDDVLSLVIWTTTDGGATWVRQAATIRTSSYLGVGARLKFVSATEGWLVGYVNHDPNTTPLLVHTCDGGQTWGGGPCRTPAGVDALRDVNVSGANVSPAVLEDAMYDVDFIGPNGWVVGNNGQILHTTDGGATWTQFRYPPGSDLLSVQMMGPDTVFVGGEGGLVLRWDKPPSRLYLPLLLQHRSP